MTQGRTSVNSRSMLVIAVAALCLGMTGCAGSSGEAADASPSASPTPSPTPQARTLTGSLTVESVSLPEKATTNGCSLLGRDDAAGYEDILPGAQVTVTDEAGTIVATSQLELGRFVATHMEQQADYSGVGDPPPMPEFDYDADTEAEWAAEDALMAEWQAANDAWMQANIDAPMIDVQFGVCAFDFTVSDLRDGEFLSVEVSHRGKVTYSRTDLEANGWAVGLTL
jgi:hypothetical protein